MNTARLLAGALGAGFYRFWHVPAPHSRLDVRDTRRADRSVIGPAALAVAAAAAVAAGRFGASLLLDERLTSPPAAPLAAPFAALPWVSQLLVVAGMVGFGLAALWWLVTAQARARVAAAVARGTVARIPDEPPARAQRLHAAVADLGRAVRDGEDADRDLGTAFGVLRAAAVALTDDPPPMRAQRRLRRRCEAVLRRLDEAPAPESTPAPAPPPLPVPATETRPALGRA